MLNFIFALYPTDRLCHIWPVSRQRRCLCFCKTTWRNCRPTNKPKQFSRQRRLYAAKYADTWSFLRFSFSTKTDTSKQANNAKAAVCRLQCLAWHKLSQSAPFSGLPTMAPVAFVCALKLPKPTHQLTAILLLQGQYIGPLFERLLELVVLSVEIGSRVSIDFQHFAWQLLY